MDFEPAWENMDAHATGSGAVVAVRQGVDECLAHGIFRIQRRILALGVALDEAGDARRVADDEGICVLEDGVQGTLERLHVTEGVARLVRVIAHGPDTDLRQATGRITGEKDVAAVSQPSITGDGKVFERAHGITAVIEKARFTFSASLIAIVISLASSSVSMSASEKRRSQRSGSIAAPRVGGEGFAVPLLDGVGRIGQHDIMHVRDALEEEEREHVGLEIGGIDRATQDVRGFPEVGFKVTDCDLERRTSSASSGVTWNMKSAGKRSRLRLPA